MTLITRRNFQLGAWCAVVFTIVALAAGEPPRTGPETETRFPPLKVPPGFRATLFACDPLIEYPSAVAIGPRSGSIFVAVDYMTGLGTEIVRRDEIRLVEDTNRDGYADRATVYASGFNSIQGLTYHDGTVYVMHAPFLTALRDTDGDGKADERRDLVTGLGLTPEENPVRLHCPNGLIMGHDNWLYLALGDHGCAVTRPEGDRLVLQGGGILRCRPDGRDLHVFATGLRNIYDVALDDELNVFLRDNENDGGDYKIRVCHSFFGADHGYPYLYYDRPQEALPPLADLGLGSSAGGLCYLEREFPSEFRGNLFFCEWGRAVVRYPLQRAGGTFAPVKEVEFAAGADNDPYGFKPTDLVVERDGSLIVADWADGQRPKRGRGRIYRITYAGGLPQPPNSLVSEVIKPDPKSAGLEQSVAQLNSESYYERIDGQRALDRTGPEGTAALNAALSKGQLGSRGRLHAVWILARANSPDSVEKLLNLAQTDPDPRIRAQAVRAAADLIDPVLIRHRLDAGPGDAEMAARLASLAAREADAQVALEWIIALGRLRWPGAPDWLRETLKMPDAALSHAAMQTLRRSENWSAILKLIDETDNHPIRSMALRALANQAQPAIAKGLIDRLGTEREPARRREYADILTRLHKKPGAWVYWGYRPPPRPANTVSWENTDAIEQALDRVLADPDRTVWLSVLRGMQREKVPTRPTTLGQCLRKEREPDAVAAILESLREHPANLVRDALSGVVTGKDQAVTNRLSALTYFAAGHDDSSELGLVDLAGLIEDGPVLADALAHIARRSLRQGSSLLLAKLQSSEPIVRAAALEGVAKFQVTEASDSVRGLLDDKDGRVRLAAASAAGRLRIQSASGSLLNMAQEADAALRRASLEALCLLKEPRAVPLAIAALNHRNTQLTALQCISELGGPAELKPVVELALRDPSADVLRSVVHLLTKWSDDVALAKRQQLDSAIAEVQGASGVLLRWKLTGPLRMDAADTLIQRGATSEDISVDRDVSNWRTTFATGAESRVALGSNKSVETIWLAFTDVQMPAQTTVQFLASSRGKFSVWLNGGIVHHRNESGAFVPDSDRFESALRAGANRLLVQVNSPEGGEFQVRFRRKSSTAEHEQLTQAALTGSGNVERGRKLFFNVEKSQCLKCHRMSGQGEQIGPELTGIGSRFSRIYVIESILEPSRTIAPSFQTVDLTLKDGQELSGIVMAAKDGTLTLADNQGRRHVVAISAVIVQRTPSLSTMPEGLEKAWTTEEFIDLVAFLVSQKSGVP